MGRFTFSPVAPTPLRSATRRPSYGHRNVQGPAAAPDGILWTHELDPRGRGEVRRTSSP
ncbi:PQQ-dependent sugar dehydrogenase [Rhodoferax ferrireducens]|uniref:PQQ-dependent sugar dehydrogenase n=1 Tax=Rhodoferax ferrireducens TaxID=192843 RepID=UPI00140FBA16|nr:PQQ-dependent sugar dehydrogenase [Rhodoferax ferrireducens]